MKKCELVSLSLFSIRVVFELLACVCMGGGESPSFSPQLRPPPKPPRERGERGGGFDVCRRANIDRSKDWSAWFRDALHVVNCLRQCLFLRKMYRVGFTDLHKNF